MSSCSAAVAMSCAGLDGPFDADEDAYNERLDFEQRESHKALIKRLVAGADWKAAAKSLVDYHGEHNIFGELHAIDFALPAGAVAPLNVALKPSRLWIDFVNAVDWFVYATEAGR